MPKKKFHRNWEICAPGATVYFKKKADAKDSRNDLWKHGVKCWISKGPDHPRLNDKGNPTTHTNSGDVGTGFRKKVK